MSMKATILRKDLSLKQVRHMGDGRCLWSISSSTVTLIEARHTAGRRFASEGHQGPKAPQSPSQQVRRLAAQKPLGINLSQSQADDNLFCNFQGREASGPC